MEEFDPIKYKQMVKNHYKNDDPYGWCDSIYEDAKGDYTKVFWADLEPSPYLVDWLEENKTLTKQKAIVIGCGVGDDAEALSSYGYEVTAFDISKKAIELCKNRYPNTKVNYIVADLFSYDNSWKEAFDLVYECNTIQILPNKYRVKARIAMSSLLKKDAHILVSCRSREKNEKENEIPLPLDFDEINEFVKTDGLKEISFLSYTDSQEPPVPHFFAVYKK